MYDRLTVYPHVRETNDVVTPALVLAGLISFSTLTRATTPNFSWLSSSSNIHGDIKTEAIRFNVEQYQPSSTDSSIAG